MKKILRVRERERCVMSAFAISPSLSFLTFFPLGDLAVAEGKDKLAASAA